MRVPSVNTAARDTGAPRLHDASRADRPVADGDTEAVVDADVVPVEPPTGLVADEACDVRAQPASTTSDARTGPTTPRRRAELAIGIRRP
jgi:hypothetical protein